MSIEDVYYYSEEEERLNITTHSFGIILSLIGFVFLFFKSLDYTFVEAGSYVIYGVSQILIFSASTYYHTQTEAFKRYVANIVDHAMIYISIAGSYTPFCIVTLGNDGGWTLLAFVWTFALIGFFLKIFYTGKYNLFSTLMYVFMGWMVVFYWEEMFQNLELNGIYLLLIGGAFYTSGAVFYMLEKIKFNHAIFHVLILLGAFCHFLTIYFYT